MSATRITPEMLLASYVEITGIRVSMSRRRRDMLAEICRLPHRFTAEDVGRVIGWIRSQQKSGASGFTGTSLLFSNVMDPDKFEERALRCRENLRRLQAKAQGAEQRAASRGPAAPQEPNVPIEEFNVRIAELKRSIRGGGGR